MAWIFLEGLDRTGKSSVAELYRSKGYEVIHLSAPDKKYRQEGYSGPSYFEDMVEFYMAHNGKNVVFDRTVYGELIWPRIYNREAQLEVDDLEYLRDLEKQNETLYYLMYDKNVKEHWQRCVDNKEPLDQRQFQAARSLFEQMLGPYGFRKVQLTDFPEAQQPGQEPPAIKEAVEELETKEEPVVEKKKTEPVKKDVKKPSGQEILQTANAINSILSARIVKRKGKIFDEIERDIREYLDKRLSALFGKDQPVELDETDYLILKRYCETVKKKMEDKK